MIDNSEVQNLDKERDERCIPIAQKIVKILGSSDNLSLGENVSHEKRIECYDPLFAEIMTELKEKNIKWSEVPYVFTLVFQAYEFMKNIVTLSMNAQMKRAEDVLWKMDADEIKIQDVDNVLVDSSKKE